MTCIILTHEIAFAREVADQIYLVIEHALSWDDVAHRLRRTSIAIPPIARHQSALPPANAVSESLAFRTRGRGLRKVILPRASVEFFDLFDLLARRVAPLDRGNAINTKRSNTLA